MVYKCISWYIMVYNGILYVSNTFKYSTPILWDPNSCIVRNILMFIWGDWMLGGGIRKHSKLDFGIWGTYTVSSYIIIKKEEISLEPKSNECITNSIQKQLLHTPLGMFLSMDWIQDQRNHPLGADQASLRRRGSPWIPCPVWCGSRWLWGCSHHGTRPPPSANSPAGAASSWGVRVRTDSLGIWEDLLRIIKKGENSMGYDISLEIFNSLINQITSVHPNHIPIISVLSISESSPNWAFWNCSNNLINVGFLVTAPWINDAPKEKPSHVTRGWKVARRHLTVNVGAFRCAVRVQTVIPGPKN